MPIKKSLQAPAIPRANPKKKHRISPPEGMKVVPTKARQANRKDGNNSLSCLCLFASAAFFLLDSNHELTHANIGRRLYGKKDIAPYAGKYSAGMPTRVFTIDSRARLETWKVAAFRA
mmetsp:Transcript_50794/g.108244  ORF Transcript_50794/g.108244 Transcript_50794/m.108244 type:complete len:118 (-) Transcript_50794:207-560(-)